MNGKSFSQAEINRRSYPKVDFVGFFAFFVFMPRDLKQLQSSVQVSQYPPLPERRAAPVLIGQELKSTSTRMQIERRQFEMLLFRFIFFLGTQLSFIQPHAYPII